MAFISAGNTKLGWIPNVSLTPGLSCKDGVPCLKSCYAMNCYKAYPDVRRNWDANLEEATSHRDKYFESIRRYILHSSKSRFRWHVGGDILDQDYFDRMRIIAADYYFVKFLVFTKMYHLNFSQAPKNLSVVLSVWPGSAMPRKRLPLAFMQNGAEDRANGIDCKSNCRICSTCWNLKELGENVILHKH